MPGNPDWAGTPLTSGLNKVATLTSNLAASGTDSKFVQFVKPGYIVNVRPQYSGASGVTPYCRTHWRWVDANPPTIDLGEQDWVTYVTPNNIYSPVLGSGPVRGQWAEIDITNLDAGQPVTWAADVWETTQHIARDDWRDSEIFNFIPGAGLNGAPGAAPGRNRLAGFSQTVAGTTDYALPLYAGQAWLTAVFNPVAGGIASFQITDVNSGAFVFDTAGTSTSAIIVAQAVTLPRAPCKLSLLPPAGGANYVISLNIMEYAS